MNHWMERALISTDDWVGCMALHLIAIHLAYQLIVRNKYHRNEQCFNQYKHIEREQKGNIVVSNLLMLMVLLTGDEWLIYQKVPVWARILFYGMCMFGYIVYHQRMIHRDTGCILVTVLAVYIISLYGAKQLSQILGGSVQRGRYNFEVAMIAYLLCILLEFMIRQSQLQMGIRTWGVMLFTAIPMFVICFTSMRANIGIAGAIIVICTIVQYGVVLYVLSQMNRKQYESEKKLEGRQEELLQQRYMETLEQQSEYLRRQRHDLKHHLQTIQQLLEQEGEGKAKQYLNQYIEESVVHQDMIHTEFPVLDALLNAKLAICKEKEIPVTMCVEVKQYFITDVEMCCVLGNLFDNAIESECALKQDMRGIAVYIEANENALDITVKNEIEESVLEKNPELKSGKKDAKVHGFGIRNIRQIVHKYDGMIDFYEENHRFCCTIQL